MDQIDLPITLRKTTKADLETLYQFQLDAEANYLVAFTPTENADREAYLKKHSKFLDDADKNTQTILLGDTIVGSVAKFEREGDNEITYWIDKKYWGKGIATIALQKFLQIEIARPIFASAAFDNMGSRSVLEKCGFVKIGTDKGFANARQVEVEEVIYKLD